MRVAIVHDKLSAGGAEQVLFRTALCLPAADVNQALMVCGFGTAPRHIRPSSDTA